MEVAILIVLLALVVLLNVVLKQKKIIVKAQRKKKEEIIEAYKNQMSELLKKYDDNKEIQIQEKIKLLKNINNELSMNIFFNEEESKKILQELSNLG